MKFTHETGLYRVYGYNFPPGVAVDVTEPSLINKFLKYPVLTSEKLNKDGSTPKKRGRKKGSTSFTKIRLKDLSDRLRNVGMTNQATIVVSKRWLEDVIEAQESLTIDPVPAKVEETEERIEFTVNTFE